MNKAHRISNNCFGCGKNISRTALTKLCYTFEVCEGKHLGEAVWHKVCFLKIHGMEAKELADAVGSQDG